VPELSIEEAAVFGEEREHGNIVAIQPFMVPSDYSSEGSFSLKINGYLDAAKQRDWFRDRTIVVLPEYLGTWLVAAGERHGVYHTSSINDALRGIIKGSPLRFLRRWLRSRVEDRGTDAIFHLKAPRMAAIYHRTFSLLAQTYHVTIVAGSIILPSPHLEAGRLAVGNGALANVSVTYRPDGAAIGMSTKVHPTDDESSFIQGGKVEDLPVLNTACGRLGVLVCADSWHPEPYQVMREKGVELLTVVSYCLPDDGWDRPWGGYGKAQLPPDADCRDIGVLTEGQAWLKYAMVGRFATCGATLGVNVFLRGSLWDLGSDGYTTVIREGTVNQLSRVSGATLVNCWL